MKILSIALLAVVPFAPLAFSADAPATQAAGQKRTTPSGLAIIEVRSDKEALKAQKGDMVWVHYTGRLQANGKQFDSSFDRKDPQTNLPTQINFVLGEGHVIKGWDEGIAGMKVGDKRQLIIRRNWPTPSAARPVERFRRIRRSSLTSNLWGSIGDSEPHKT